VNDAESFGLVFVCLICFVCEAANETLVLVVSAESCIVRICSDSVLCSSCVMLLYTFISRFVDHVYAAE